MPVEPWNPEFSDAKPEAKPKQFFEGTTKYYIMLERGTTAHQGAAPNVTIGILRTGTSLPDDHHLAEGDREYTEGVKCVGIADAPDRNPGEIITANVSVTWQTDPFQK